MTYDTRERAKMAFDMTTTPPTDGQALVYSTSSSKWVPGSQAAAAAWVNFDGTGTVAIRGAYNVSSITDNGTGTYQINFTDSMADTNYAVSMTIQLEAGSGSTAAGMCGKDVLVASTTTYFSAVSLTKDSTARADTSYAYVIVFR